MIYMLQNALLYHVNDSMNVTYSNLLQYAQECVFS